MMLVTQDLFTTAPTAVKNSIGAVYTEWREFYDWLNEQRDAVVSTPTLSSNSADDLNYMYNLIMAKVEWLVFLTEWLNVEIFPEDDEVAIRRRIFHSPQWNNKHATVEQLLGYIFSITGVEPKFVSNFDFSVGWDELDAILVPDYQGGFGWDDTGDKSSSLPQYIWFDAVIQQPIILNLGNDGNYTSEQLSKIEAFVKKHKPASRSFNIGYLPSSGSTEAVVLITIPENRYPLPNTIPDMGINP